MNRDEKGTAIAGLPKLSLLGIALLVIGFVGPAALATVHIDSTTPSYSSYWPDGSSSSPVTMAPGESGRVKMVVDESLATHKVKIDKGDDGTWDKTLTLPLQDTSYGYSSYFTNWSFPTSAQKIEFEFVAADDAGNTNTKTGYAEIGKPTGDLYINGQLVQESSDITLSTNTLNFTVEVTQQPDMVNDVTVRVVDTDTITLSKEDSNTYTGSTDLSDGTYTIKAYVHDTNNNAYRIASILAGIGEEPRPTSGTSQDSFFWLKVIGAVMIPVGFFVRW